MTYDPSAAHGCEIKIGNGASPEVFNALKGVSGGPSGAGYEPQMLEGRFHHTTGTVRKATGVNTPPLQFNIAYDSTDTYHAALLTAAQNKTRKNFKVILTDQGAEEHSFAAFVAMTLSSDVGEFVTYRVTLHVDGTPTTA